MQWGGVTKVKRIMDFICFVFCHDNQHLWGLQLSQHGHIKLLLVNVPTPHQLPVVMFCLETCGAVLCCVDYHNTTGGTCTISTSKSLAKTIQKVFPWYLECWRQILRTAHIGIMCKGCVAFIYANFEKRKKKSLWDQFFSIVYLLLLATTQVWLNTKAQCQRMNTFAVI